MSKTVLEIWGLRLEGRAAMAAAIALWAAPAVLVAIIAAVVHTLSR